MNYGDEKDQGISAYTMHDMPKNQRPRELLARMGAKNVPEGTLLAILLGSGSVGQNVIDLANEMLAHYGSLTAMAEANDKDLQRFKGIGPAKAKTLVAALELARRMSLERRAERPEISGPRQVAEMIRDETQHAQSEVFYVFCLDRRNRLKEGPIKVTEGILDATLVHPREVFELAVRHLSASIVVAHNHPSGDPTPSSNDIKLTRKLVESGKILGIEVMDHVVVGKEIANGAPWFYSIREADLVRF